MSWTLDEENAFYSRSHELVVSLGGEAIAGIVDRHIHVGFDRFIEKVKALDLEPDVLVQIYFAACDYRGTLNGIAGSVRFRAEEIIDAALPVECAKDEHSPCCRRP